MIISNELYDLYDNMMDFLGQPQYMDTFIYSPHNPELPARMSELVDTSNSVTAKVNGLTNHFVKLRARDQKLIIANEYQFISMWHDAMILHSKIMSKIKDFLVSLNKYVYFIILVR
jgi:hypothetical protein